MNESPQVRHETIGPLSCIVVEPPREGSAVHDSRIPVILCHGYGAPGDDLAGLAEPLIQWLGDSASCFKLVFPAAPNDLASMGMPDGRAWWSLNMAALQNLLATSQFEQLHESTPPGLAEARAALTETILAVLGPDFDPSSPYVLGGFSQGAMVTMDVVLQSTVPPPSLLIQFSGTLICHDQWRSQLSRLSQTAILQSHGRFDPILPFTSAEALRDLIGESAAELEFVAFDGPHTIETETLMKFTQRLHAMAQAHGREPSGADDS